MNHDPNDKPDIVILPPVAFALALGLAVGLGYLAPLGLLPPRGGWSLVPGLVLIAAALALGGGGIWAFKAAGTNVHPTEPALVIVENGPYRFTRNPMYLGLVTLMLGLGLAVPLDWALLLAPSLWAVLHYGVVLREEAYLTAKFGETYTAFKARTRRWL